MTTKLRSPFEASSPQAEKVADVFYEPDGSIVIEWYGAFIRHVIEQGETNKLLAAIRETADRLGEVFKANVG